MVKSEIYIGLHDSTTKTQLFENEKYIRVLRNVCHSYKVPFSFGIQEGGYIYENGEYARETSLVLTLTLMPPSTFLRSFSFSSALSILISFFCLFMLFVLLYNLCLSSTAQMIFKFVQCTFVQNFYICIRYSILRKRYNDRAILRRRRRR